MGAAAREVALLGGADAADGDEALVSDGGASDDSLSSSAGGAARLRWLIGLGGISAVAAVVARSTGALGMVPAGAGGTSKLLDLFSFDIMKDLDRCSKTDCNSCLGEQGCRWCPSTKNCHDESSIEDKCDIPINSQGQCWGQTCAYQIGEFLNHRADDAKQWMLQTVESQDNPLLPFPTYTAPATGIFDLATGQQLQSWTDGTAVHGYTIAAIADWGTGTCAARAVGRLAAAERPDMTVHMGDVYFVATPAQFRTNFNGLAKNPNQEGVAFPRGKTVTFAMMGNHELISGCAGLYQEGFTYTGQRATYAVWQSDKWRIVALDTGRLCYPTEPNGARNVAAGETDAPMPTEVVDWLVNTVRLGDPSDTRGILLLSHHQPYDAFSVSYKGAAMQLDKIIPKGKQIVWLFGHNHALAIYQKMQLEGTDIVAYPRLIGIGGFPNILQKPKRTEALVAYDARTFQSIPDDDMLSQRIGFNGYAKMVVNGDSLDIQYITAKCLDGDCEKGLSETESTVVATETFTVESTGSVTQSEINIDSALTKVNAPTDVGATASCIPQSEIIGYDPSLNHYD